MKLLSKQWTGKSNGIQYRMDINPPFQDGLYINPKGTVTIYGATGKDGSSCTIFTMLYNGKSYHRRYETLFTDRGNQMIAARLIRDVGQQ